MALGNMGDSRAIKPLSELLRTENWEHLVRKEIKIALEKLKG
jgi:HEAT repeat protein